jgi:hypothetical protein
LGLKNVFVFGEVVEGTVYGRRKEHVPEFFGQHALFLPGVPDRDVDENFLELERDETLQQRMPAMQVPVYDFIPGHLNIITQFLKLN